jgi:DNA-binding transcriptional regulator YhcF (GntR family)
MPSANVTVDENASEPPYLQVADGLRNEILSGGLPPGARLPAQRLLAAELRVAVGTVKTAYGILLEERLTRSTPLGTFVVARGEINVARRNVLDMATRAFRDRYLAKGFTRAEVRSALRRVGEET